MTTMKRILLLLVLLSLTADLCFAESLNDQTFLVTTVRGRVYYKNRDEQPFSLTSGEYQFATGTSLLTFIDGQCYVMINKNLEMRMKEEAIAAFPDPGNIALRKGLIGFKSDNEKIIIDAVHLKVELDDGLCVIKSNPVLTRVCLIKGTARIKQGKMIATELKPGFEIAASVGNLSKPYKYSDELRYTWYWLAPEKEPSLQ